MGQRSMDSSHHHAATALNQTRSDTESCCVGLGFGCVGKLTSGVGEGGNVFDSMDSNHHHVATALNQTRSDGSMCSGSLTGWLCIEIVPHVLGAVVESWRLHVCLFVTVLLPQVHMPSQYAHSQPQHTLSSNDGGLVYTSSTEQPLSATRSMAEEPAPPPATTVTPAAAPAAGGLSH